MRTSRAAIVIICLALSSSLCQAVPTIVGAQATQSAGDSSSAVSLSLPSGCQLYVYGVTTGGAYPMNAFASGQTIQLKDVNGNVAAQLAVTTDSNNSYTTATSYHVFGGFGVSGFHYVQGFYGANPGPGPNFQASVQLTLTAPAMVAIMGMGSSQTVLTLSGLDNPIIDAPVQTAQPATEALIIAHQYLSAGTYTIQETTGDGFAGQTPQNEVDLIGVLVLSDQPNVATSANPHIPIDLSSKSTPANPDENVITTGQSIPTWGGTGGQIRISSGTGTFASVSDANNVLRVPPGTTLNGTITLETQNLGPSGAVAPLIYTPSWGDHSTSWKLINGWIPTGQSEQQAQVSLVTPTTPGVYHIIFAACWEIGGDHVASATTWGLGKDTWNDGNDIAEFNATQISSAQLNGWATNSEMYGPDSSHSTTWYQQRYYPADAITLIVTGAGAAPSSEPTQPAKNGNPKSSSNNHIPVARFLGWGVAVLIIIGMAIAVIRLIMPRRGSHGGNRSAEK